MKSIVHVMQNGAFFADYIKYMRENFGMLTHQFILYGDQKAETSQIIQEEKETIYFITSAGELLYNRKIYRLLMESERIIINGVFGIERAFFFYPNRIWKKIYLQCWGADFYSYRTESKAINKKIEKCLKWKAYQKCHSILNLIEEDYDEFMKVFPVQTPHKVVPMPGDSSKQKRISERYFNTNKTYKIVLGNSATKENCHKEVIDILTRFRDENILIYCPLSYGDEKYKEEIIQYGQEKLKEKFVPVVEYLEYDEYVEFLSSCSIGIYNNNRQQAMGNILLMALLGKRVFLREGTAMWKHFLRLGVKLHTIEDLKKITYEELWNISNEERLTNRQAIWRYNQETVKKQWENFLKDIIAD